MTLANLLHILWLVVHLNLGILFLTTFDLHRFFLWFFQISFWRLPWFSNTLFWIEGGTFDLQRRIFPWRTVSAVWLLSLIWEFARLRLSLILHWLFTRLLTGNAHLPLMILTILTYWRWDDLFHHGLVGFEFLLLARQQMLQLFYVILVRRCVLHRNYPRFWWREYLLAFLLFAMIGFVKVVSDRFRVLRQRLLL